MNSLTAIVSINVIYLALFFAMSATAAHAIGKSVWLFGSSAGVDRLAAHGFRAAFALAIVAPLLLNYLPELNAFDLMRGMNSPLLSSVGHIIAVSGAMIAFAAQVSMGASWRVGVRDDAVGPLVGGGLYNFSRNPTFAGQALLLAGTAIALPSVMTLLAVCLFVWSASTQIRSEERALLRVYGEQYSAYCKRVPRWFGAAKGFAV